MATSGDPVTGTPARFPMQQMLAAARMYFLDELTQGEIAHRLGTSQASVSRLLSEARRQGIVKIEISPPHPADVAELARLTAEALGLASVHLIAGGAVGPSVGAALGPALREALAHADLRPGDVLLTASGRMVHESSRADLPRFPGVVVAPVLGGQDEPEPWYQPNEIARNFCDRIGGRPAFLYAPALPGPDLHQILRNEPSIRRALDLWPTARAAIVGVGAPPLSRTSLPAFVPTDAVSLRDAVGDVASRFYDKDGREVDFPGSDRLVAIPLDVLSRTPVVIGVAVGEEKVDSILVAARSGYINRLVTDPDTAALLLAAATDAQPDRSDPATAAPPT